jgi:hypothetical protein
MHAEDGTRPMLRRAAITASFLLALPTLALTQTAPEAPPPAAPAAAEPSDSIEQPMVGDHWTYEFYDEISGQLKNSSTFTITDISKDEIALRVETPGFPVNFVVYDRGWNTKNNNIWKYTPNDGTGVKSPLTVGGTWRFQGDDFNSTHNVSFNRTGTSKVVGQESVTTSAGTFDTFKIETTMSLRNANDPTKTAQAVGTMWYAPAIDHWVKRTFKQSSNGHVDSAWRVELVDYGRR